MVTGKMIFSHKNYCNQLTLKHDIMFLSLNNKIEGNLQIDRRYMFDKLYPFPASAASAKNQMYSASMFFPVLTALSVKTRLHCV